MITINIRVYRQVQVPGGISDKELYRNSIEWNEDIVFPFDNFVKVLKTLYPHSSTFVVFSVS